jgi:uncharacterized membrane protein
VPTVEVTEFPLALVVAVVLGGILGGAIVWRRVLSRPRVPRPELEAKPPGAPIIELDRKLLSYLAERRGELSIPDASRELGVSADEIKAALERLRRAGRVEIE